MDRDGPRVHARRRSPRVAETRTYVRRSDRGTAAYGDAGAASWFRASPVPPPLHVGSGRPGTHARRNGGGGVAAAGGRVCMRGDADGGGPAAPSGCRAAHCRVARRRRARIRRAERHGRRVEPRWGARRMTWTMAPWLGVAAAATGAAWAGT